MRYGQTWLLPFVLAVAAASGCDTRDTSAPSNSPAQRPNVLLICIDDLRCSLGCYGDEQAKTPNIDQFAKNARLFTNHFVYCASCAPSRSTLLTGHRLSRWDAFLPHRLQTTGELRPDFQPEMPLPRLFRDSGYRTVGIGKISHQPGGVMDQAQRQHEVPESWDVSYMPVGPWQSPWRAFFAYADGGAYNAAAASYDSAALRRGKPRPPYEQADVPDDGYPDGLIATEAVERLKQLANQSQPFFIAVGFLKPHLPFNAPKRYWDLYDPQSLPPAPYAERPRHVEAEYAVHDSYELTHYDWPSGAGNVSTSEGRILRHGYYAAVSYVDAQIGKILDEAERLGLFENTIVVLWSDHGYQLGDHGMWGKATAYDASMRSPLIIRTPGMKHPGRAANGIVESVDLFPTLAALCNLEPPKDLSGMNLEALLNDPNRLGKSAAIGVVLREKHVARTIRTARHRLIEWMPRNNLNRVSSVELYDYEADPHEAVNVAAQAPELVDQLQADLQRQHQELQ